MKALSAIGVMALVFGSLGCEASECDNEETGADGVCLESLTRFEGTADTQSQPYTSGATVSIDSENGRVRVVQGTSADVVGTFEPFVLRGASTSEEDVAADLARLTGVVSLDGSNVVVNVERESGSQFTLGADVLVELPSTFDGILSVNQENGQTDVDFVGSAIGVLVTSDNGGCDVETGSARDISVSCDNGDLERPDFGGISDSVNGSGFSTGNGSITLALPAGGVFSVQAQALGGGEVVINGAPATCPVNEASPSAKTVSCNGATAADPIYQATAERHEPRRRRPKLLTSRARRRPAAPDPGQPARRRPGSVPQPAREYAGYRRPARSSH